jgi:hypothetical protein
VAPSATSAASGAVMFIALSFQTRMGFFTASPSRRPAFREIHLEERVSVMGLEPRKACTFRPTKPALSAD